MVDFEYDSTEAVLTCTPSGRMDALTAQKFDAELQAKLDGPTPLRKCVFDLARVEYVASAFLRVCLVTVKKFPAGAFSVINTAPQVKKIFAVAGLADGFVVS